MTEQTVSVSGKERLLNLMREVAVDSTDAKHEAQDDGEGRCVTCGRNVHPYSGVIQHQRGWGGSAKGKDRVPLTVKQLSLRLGLGEHETGHLMWSLQKQGYVTFRTGNGSGTATDISRIRLTPLGAGKTSREVIKQIEDSVLKGNGTAAFHPEIKAAREAINDMRAALPEPELTMAEAAALATPAQVAEAMAAPPYPTRLPRLVLDLNVEKYPLIVDLLSRAAKRRQVQDAALMLENAGFIDLATAALTAVPDDSDLEAEVLDLLAAHGVKG